MIKRYLDQRQLFEDIDSGKIKENEIVFLCERPVVSVSGEEFQEIKDNNNLFYLFNQLPEEEDQTQEQKSPEVEKVKKVVQEDYEFKPFVKEPKSEVTE